MRSPTRISGACVLIVVPLAIGLRSASAGLIGDNVQISAGTGCRFPDAAYNRVGEKYLVVYTNYSFSPPRISGRFLTAAGAVEGGEFFISDATGGLFAAVAYNAANNEFLVTWDDQRASPYPIWGQRVRGSDGSLLGGNFQIGSAGGIRSAVAWSSVSNNYLVVWYGGSPIDVYGQLVSNTGALQGGNINISNDSAYSGYPAVAYGLSGNQYLVTWDHSPNDAGYIRGRRINAATGGLLGDVISVTTNGTEDRSCIAYDHANSRWLVQYNRANPGLSYDQYGQLVSTTGALVGGPLAIAATAAFEGDTLFGGDIAFVPGAARYFSSFQLYPSDQGGMGGQELFNSGLPVVGQLYLSHGQDGSLNNAADTNLDRFLTVWDRLPEGYIFGQLYQVTDLTPPDPVTDFTAVAGSRSITLGWANPSTPDFAGTAIRYKTTGFPTGPADGQLLIDKPNAPGSFDTFAHTNLPSGIVHYYAAFAYDEGLNYAEAATASEMPATFGDFDADGDVDQEDFGHMQLCFSGSGLTYQPGCRDADCNNDSDVDLDDFIAFQTCLGGVNQPPPC